MVRRAARRWPFCRRVPLLIALFALAACKPSRKEVVVLAAASLARALSDLEERLEQEDPKIDVRLEISGSQTACRKVSELNRRADVVASADFTLIDQLLRPKHARFNIRFTTNSIVLAHLEHSRFTEEITSTNWPAILSRPRVRLGFVNPRTAPIGYRTMLVWQLAERQLARKDPSLRGLAKRLRGGIKPDRIAPHESELLKLLQARAIDYAFIYGSTAEEHNLKVVRLPGSYNLGSTSHAGAYGKATVQLSGGLRIRGTPVVYGVTIPRGAPNPAGARTFVKALLGRTGQRILKRTGFSPLTPALCADRGELPAKLRGLTRASAE